MQVTLTKLAVKDARRSKTGRAFRGLDIQTAEHGDKWLSGFIGEGNEAWRVGQTVEIEVTENGKYLNYKTTGQRNVLTALWEIVNRLELETGIVKGSYKKNKPAQTQEEESQNEIQVDDLPF